MCKLVSGTSLFDRKRDFLFRFGPGTSLFDRKRDFLFRLSPGTSLFDRTPVSVEQTTNRGLSMCDCQEQTLLVTKDEGEIKIVRKYS